MVVKANGLSAYHVAAMHPDPKLLDYLLRLNKHWNIDMTDNEGVTLAYIASMLKRYDNLNLLLEYKADMTQMDIRGYSAYDRIIDNDDYHLFEILYE